MIVFLLGFACGASTMLALVVWRVGNELRRAGR